MSNTGLKNNQLVIVYTESSKEYFLNYNVSGFSLPSLIRYT